MSERRVVVTGFGIVSCVGNNSVDFWDSLINGRCGLGPVTRFDASEYRTHVAGELKNFDITDYMPAKEARRLDPFCHYAIAAAAEAAEMAGLPSNLADAGGLDPDRVGVLVGSGIGGIQTLENQCFTLHDRGPSKVSPFLIPMMIIDMASGILAMRYGAKGPNLGAVTACATATHSIGEACGAISRGAADIMICGGAEAAVSKVGFAGFCSMKAMSPNDDPMTASRPFDADRDGFVMSEGAGILILEELEHAKKRGAGIFAEIAGYGATADAYHITSPAPDGAGAAKALRTALDFAKVAPEALDYINAHGTSTPLNDKFETKAIKLACGDHARKVAISSTKGTTGHGLGAAGGFETIACVKAINEGVVPPTINYHTPDPECDLNYTPNTAVERDIRVAANINLGFGGHNGALIVKKFA